MRALLFGHTHTDEFRVMATPPKATKAFGAWEGGPGDSWWDVASTPLLLVGSALFLA